MGDGRDEAAGGAAQEQKAEHGGNLPRLSQPRSHALTQATRLLCWVRDPQLMSQCLDQTEAGGAGPSEPPQQHQ